ncbi:MAG: hypothetical protein JJ895_11945 [Balneolaceae bacterium]|nr:hypothetical protein [Balneolaceae bacterium]
MRSQWEIFDLNSQQVIHQTDWEYSNQIRKPERASFSDDGSVKAVQINNSSTSVTHSNGSKLLLDNARSPQLSPDGDYMSSSDFNTIEVIQTETGTRFSITNKSDYSVYNPTAFLRDELGVLITETKRASDDLRDMAIRKISFDEFGVTDSSTKFRLIQYTSLDSLDFLYSRASQPVDLGNNNVFFLLFQHKLSLCE